ncbi:MAG: hypothetical protein AAF518_26305, partial [Spirochaetota bacterium]
MKQQQLLRLQALQESLGIQEKNSIGKDVGAIFKKGIFSLLTKARDENYDTLSMLEKARLLVILLSYLKNQNMPLAEDVEFLLQDKEFIERLLSDSEYKIVDYLLKKILLVYSAYQVEGLPIHAVLKTFFSNSKNFWKEKNTFLFALASGGEGFYEAIVTDCVINQTPIRKLWRENVGSIYDVHARFHIRKITVALWKYFSRSVHLIENEATFLYIFHEVLQPNDSDASERLGWILQNLDKVAFHLAQRPLLEYLNLLLGTPPDWSYFPGLVDRDKNTYLRLWESFQYDSFYLLAKNYFYESDMEEEEKKLLNNKLVFWLNYKRQIRWIKTYYPKQEIKTLQESLAKGQSQ